MNKNEIDDELVRACQNLVKEIDRVQQAKKAKKEEEEKAEAEKEARRDYWAEKLYSDYSEPMTLIIPEDSKFKK